MIHVYALSRDAPVLDLAGIDDRPVELLPAGDLTAVVSTHPAAPRPTAEAALLHARVTADVDGQVAVLPVRFGTHHPDAFALRRAIDARRGELHAALREVAGRVEFVLRAEPRAVASGAVGSATVAEGEDRGRAYLARRLADERQQDAAWTEATCRLADVAADLDALAVRAIAGRSRRGPERSYLVERAETERFRARAAAQGAGRDGVVVGGPWLPYSFAAVAAT